MTEAGKNWLVDIDKKHGRSMTHLAQYESVLADFCKKVEEKAIAKGGMHDMIELGSAFNEIKKELIGT